MRTKVRVAGAPLLLLRLLGSPTQLLGGSPPQDVPGLFVSVHWMEPGLQPTIPAGCVFVSVVGTGLPHTTSQRAGFLGSPARSPLLAK